MPGSALGCTRAFCSTERLDFTPDSVIISLSISLNDWNHYSISCDRRYDGCRTWTQRVYALAQLMESMLALACETSTPGAEYALGHLIRDSTIVVCRQRHSVRVFAYM